MSSLGRVQSAPLHTFRTRRWLSDGTTTARQGQGERQKCYSFGCTCGSSSARFSIFFLRSSAVLHLSTLLGLPLLTLAEVLGGSMPDAQ